jgi:hypothetical protein
MAAVFGRRGLVGIVVAVALATAPAAVSADGDLVVATLGSTPISRPIPDGFVGVSLEFKALHLYTGRDPTAINPVFVQLLRNLAPGQSPIVRIGGNSTDDSWWPVPGVVPRAGLSYRLTKGWLRTTRALAAALNARLILGVNLAAGRPELAAAEARAFEQGIGRRYIAALEVGNEPDVYPSFAWYRNSLGRVFFARGRGYSPAAYMRDFARWRAALPGFELAGPAWAHPDWLPWLDRYVAERGLGLVTLHRYPLRGCAMPSSPTFASIPHLLGDTASSGLAQAVAPYAAIAHAHGLALRLDEINSAACSGKVGVSDTFSSALWALDTLFNLASVGVDGVNLHSLPGAGYELFTFKHTAGGWQAFVHPEYYGLLMFAQAAPPGSRLLPVAAPPGPVKLWATAGRDGRTRVVAINKDSSAHQVALQVPTLGTTATLEWLTAPGLAATADVTLAGVSFGPQTDSGALNAPLHPDIAYPFLNTYTLDVPAGSAVLVTL